MRKILRRLGLAAFFASVFCFLFALFCNIVAGGLGIQAISSSIEVPLGSPKLLSVDTHGHICYHSRHYNRLQIYNRNGDFVRGWFVPSGYTARIDFSGDFIRAVDLQGHNIVYDFSGKILRKYHEKGSSEIWRDWYRETRKDGEGNTYTGVSILLKTEVARVDPNGQQTIVLREPFYLRLFRIPFPAFAYLWACALLLFFSEVVLKKRKTSFRVWLGLCSNALAVFLRRGFGKTKDKRIWKP